MLSALCDKPYSTLKDLLLIAWPAHGRPPLLWGMHAFHAVLLLAELLEKGCTLSSDDLAGMHTTGNGCRLMATMWFTTMVALWASL